MLVSDAAELTELLASQDPRVAGSCQARSARVVRWSSLLALRVGGGPPFAHQLPTTCVARTPEARSA